MVAGLDHVSGHSRAISKSTWSIMVENNDLADLRNGTTEAKRAYITQIISVAADDAKNVITVATVALAIILFFVKDSVHFIRHLVPLFRWAAVLAAVALFAGAALLFWYASIINYTRMDLTRCLASNDAKGAHEIWAGKDKGIRRQKGSILVTGRWAISVGIVMAAVVTCAILLKLSAGWGPKRLLPFLIQP
jgi:hypothetical protein